MQKLNKEQIESFFAKSRETIEKIKKASDEAKAFSQTDTFIQIVEKCKDSENLTVILKDQKVEKSLFGRALFHYEGEYFDKEYVMSDEWDSAHFKMIKGVVFKCSSTNPFIFNDPNDEDYQLHSGRMDVVKYIDEIGAMLQEYSKNEDFFTTLTSMEKMYFQMELNKINQRTEYEEKLILFVTEHNSEIEDEMSEALLERLFYWKVKINDYKKQG